METMAKCASYYLQNKESANLQGVLGDLGERVSSQRCGQRFFFFVQPAKIGTVTCEQLSAMFFPLNEL